MDDDEKKILQSIKAEPSEPQSAEALRDALRAKVPLPSQLERQDLGQTEHLESPLSEDHIQEIVDVLNGDVSQISAIATQAEVETAIDTLMQIAPDPRRAASIEAIVRWVRGQPFERMQSIERFVAQKIANTKSTLTFSLLALFGRLQEERPAFFVEDELAVELGSSHSISPVIPAMDQFIAMSRLENLRAHILAHGILDFFQKHICTVQDHLRSGEFEGFTRNLESILGGEQRFIKNYLLAKHIDDCLDLIVMEEVSLEEHDKPDTIHGIAGGALDETIFTFTHLEESWEIRQRLGIRDGYPVRNPLLPVMPGYVGFYDNGNLVRVYRDRALNVDEYAARERTRVVSAQHGIDPSLCHALYQSLNARDETRDSRGRFLNPQTRGLRKLEAVFAFFDTLRAQGIDQFYCDLSQIDVSGLHPMVLGKLLTRNQEYINATEGVQNESEQLTEEGVDRLLFPLDAADRTEKRALYRFLSCLSTRKKIMDDFGVELADHPAWVQRNFLTFLETRNLDDVEHLFFFIKRFEGDALTAFLTTEGDADFGNLLIHISDQFGTAAQPVFAKYAELARAAYTVEEYLIEMFGDQKDVTHEMIQSVRLKILDRGKHLLRTLAAAEPRRGEGGEPLLPHAIERALGRAESAATIFAASFKTFKTMKGAIEFSKIATCEFLALMGGPDGGLTSHEADQVRDITLENYPPEAAVDTLKGELGYSWEFIDERRRELDAAIENSNTFFYLVKHTNGDLIAFCRFDVLPNGHLNFASMHVNQKYGRSKIGETLIQKTVDIRARNHVIEAHCDARTDTILNMDLSPRAMNPITWAFPRFH